MDNNLCSVQQAKQIDLVIYLESLGFHPQKIRGNDYWYLSPFREEQTASFKVSRKLNAWYDHGIGKGGNLVDFGVLYYGCTVKELLQKLAGKTGPHFSFHPPFSPSQTVNQKEGKELFITAVNPITSPSLLSYLSQRNIGPELARQYLEEVSFGLYGKPYTALGFKNNSGGHELRSAYFKGSSAPKDVTLLDPVSSSISVFEGCFSFLSYLSLREQKRQENNNHLPEEKTGFLILNSLSFLEKSRPLLEQYTSIHLYLDRDTAGLKATAKALSWSLKYRDESTLYQSHKDLNDYLRHPQSSRYTPQQRQKQGRGRGV